MNCSQARTLLAAYQELTNDQIDTAALEEHLETCASCRQLHVQSRLIGERLRALPPVVPSQEAHTKLMQALAAEHSRYIQRTSPGERTAPVPAFLAPYMREQRYKHAETDALTAFSTADTGPLPIIQMPRRRRSAHMGHFAIIGIAASFLMVLMAGGLTSLLLLANSGSGGRPGGGGSASLTQFAQVSLANYTTTSEYSHVVSAVANRNAIFYTAYADDEKGWMLSQIDNKTRVSTALLDEPTTASLIVLGSSDHWLVWLEMGAPKEVAGKPGHLQTRERTTRSWSLKALEINANAEAMQAESPLVLRRGVYDQNAVPAWVYTPIQGIWFTQDTLLVATVDSKGKSHLFWYRPTSEDGSFDTLDTTPVELATASDGHIITSPTADSAAKSIYWSEEWMTDKDVLRSNIWEQKTIPQANPGRGKWVPQTTTDKYLFLSDESSFHPQVVNDTLFLLNTNIGPRNAIQSNSGATATSVQTSPTPIPANLPAAFITGRVDPMIYGLQADESLQGILLAYSTIDDSPLQAPLDNNDIVSAPQGGSRFIIWQSRDKGVGMYDAVAKAPVNVGANTIPTDASFLAVNGDTAIWMVNTAKASGPTSPTTTPDPNSTAVTNPSITFNTFNWPPKAKK